MAIIFSDAFTEGADTSLASHTPTTGTSWTLLWNTNDNIYKIVAATDRVAQDKAGSNNSGAIYTADATYSTADYDVSWTIVSREEFGSQSYLLARIQDQENMYACFCQGFGDNTGQIYKKVTGTWTALGSTFTVPADGSVLKFRVNGSSLKVYDDGVEIASATDTAISAAGKAGIAGGGGAELINSNHDMGTFSNVAFDDFLVETIPSAVKHLAMLGVG